EVAATHRDAVVREPFARVETRADRRALGLLAKLRVRDLRCANDPRELLRDAVGIETLMGEVVVVLHGCLLARGPRSGSGSRAERQAVTVMRRAHPASDETPLDARPSDGRARGTEAKDGRPARPCFASFTLDIAIADPQSRSRSRSRSRS